MSLLKSLFERFSTSARRRGHRALIVFLPQLADLMQRRTAVHYQNFLRRESPDSQVIDLTDALAGAPCMISMLTTSMVAIYPPMPMRW